MAQPDPDPLDERARQALDKAVPLMLESAGLSVAVGMMAAAPSADVLKGLLKAPAATMTATSAAGAVAGAAATAAAGSELDRLRALVNSDVMATVPDVWAGMEEHWWTRLGEAIARHSVGIGAEAVFNSQLKAAATLMAGAKKKLDEAEQFATGNDLIIEPDLTVAPKDPKNHPVADELVAQAQNMVYDAEDAADEAQQKISDANDMYESNAEDVVDNLFQGMMMGPPGPKVPGGGKKAPKPRKPPLLPRDRVFQRGGLRFRLRGTDEAWEALKAMPKGYAVYRVRNGSGQVIYVGVTRRGWVRWGEHLEKKGGEWLGQASSFEFIGAGYDERQALALEHDLITHEKPLFNQELTFEKRFHRPPLGDEIPKTKFRIVLHLDHM